MTRNRGVVWEQDGWAVVETCENSLFTVWRGQDLVFQVLILRSTTPTGRPMIKIEGGEGATIVDSQIWIEGPGWPALFEAFRRAEAGAAEKMRPVCG